MSLLLPAGILAIVGSILFLLTPMFTSRGLYEMTAEKRMEYVEANPGPIRLQNILLSLGGFLPAVGYLLWTLTFREQGALWMHVLGAASLLVGAVLLAVYFYQLYRDPKTYYQAKKVTWPGKAYFVLIELAFILYGVLFIQTDFPNWLGFLSIAVAVGMLVWLLVVSWIDLPPQPLFLVTLIAGIVFLVF